MRPRFLVSFVLLVGCARAFSESSARPTELLTGDAATGDWRTDAPGVRRRITPADLPPPHATPSVDEGSVVVARPANALPRVPGGFRVEPWVSGLTDPRVLRVAPNGDVFVAESRRQPPRIVVVRGAEVHVFAEDAAQGLDLPFGIAFRPGFVYVANNGSVVRFPYVDGDLAARGPAETVVPNLPGGGLLRGGGHFTRDIAFSRDGSRMFVSIGSFTDSSDDPTIEHRRAQILAFTPEGEDEQVYSTGLRNPVGLAVHPTTGDLWTTQNERDGLGDHLVPDYVTRVREGAFFGWPWFYIGRNEDPRHAGKRPDLRASVAVPDVLVQAHSSTLGIAIYTGTQFPREWRDGAFVALHGSWNRQHRTGYKVVFLPAPDGVPTGEYVDFMTGFVMDAGNVFGRPVGVAVAHDGALLVSDDAWSPASANRDSVWRVTFAR